MQSQPQHNPQSVGVQYQTHFLFLARTLFWEEYINRGMDDTMGGACSMQRHDRGNSSSRNDRNRCVSFIYDVDTIFDCIHARVS
jgi:hypothetical protein